MSFYFLVTNLHFAFGMIGAIVLLMVAWLNYDSFKQESNSLVLMRCVGLLFFLDWQILHSLDIKNDLLLYFGYALMIIGLAFIVTSFAQAKKLSMTAVIVIPAFTLYIQQLSIISSVLFFAIAYFAFRQWKREYNKTWVPFAVAFLIFGISYSISIFASMENHTSLVYITSNLIELFGFVFLGVWVWQYMRLRISESVVMILIGVIFILSTIITLAFSTILIGRVINETSNNLLTDVKVLDFSLNGMKREALSKAQLISKDISIINAVNNNDFNSLDEISGLFLEKYNLGFLIITDKNGAVLVRGNALSKRGDSLSGEMAFEEALLKNSMVTIEDSSAEGFSIRAGAPIYDKNNKIIGVVLDGFQLDNTFTDKMKKLTGFEMFVYKNDISIAGSALGIDGRTRLIGNKIDDPAIYKSILAEGKNFTGSIDINGTRFHSSYLPLINGDDKIVGMIASAKPEQDIVNIADATNRLTLLTVLGILLVLVFPIYFVSKKIAENR
jgi:hypothetical protein